MRKFTFGLSIKRTLSTLILFLFMGLNIANAIPAFPGAVNFTQPNGYVLSIKLHGDEFVHWSETSDGLTVLQNKQGYYVYAVYDTKGFLIPGKMIAHNPNDRDILEMNFASNQPKSIRFSQAQIDAQLDKFNVKNGAKMGGFPTTGARKLLMILANFTDTQTTFTQTNFDNYMNQVNYNGTGSFKDYYLENSYGQLVVTTTVTVWVTVPNTHDYYGPDAKWGEFAYEATKAANTAGIDFSQFDNDGNGIVDGIAIIHQGEGQEVTGDITDIWSHSWSLASAGYSTTLRTFDGVLADAYTAQPERLGTAMGTIGVMCHEFGHNLSAPDYYDTDYATGGQYDGTGKWDVMASGSYNGSPSGSKPAHHNMFTKNYYYHWTTPVLLSAASNVTLKNAAQYAESYYYTTATTNEYFLVENRQKVGFDAYLPGSGMIIYHVDRNYIDLHYAANNINAASHQGMYPKAAGLVINSTSCPFPGSGLETSFTDLTSPNSKSWLGVNTNKPITSIVDASGIITFAFMGGTSTDTQAPTAPTNLAASSIAQTTCSLSWTASTDNVGVTGYEIYKNGVLLTTVTTTSYAVTGLTASTAYTFYVKAKDAAGNVSAASSTVNVTTLAVVVDTQAPTAPTNLASSSVTSTSCSLSWTASTDNIGVTGYEVYKNGVLLTTVTTTSYAVTGLTASTAYTFYVKAKDAAGNVSAASSTINVTTSATTITYCASKGNSVADEWINKVAFGTISNTSGANAGYANFTALSTTVTKGSAYTITITPAWSGTVYSEGYAVWIDYNKDGDFLDAGEAVFSKATSTSTTAVGTFTIPTTAITGTTRMRVSMKYNAIPTSCEAFSYGEVEDYTVNMIAGVVDTQAPTAPTNLASSSITSSSCSLSWTASTDNVGVTGYDIYKNGVLLTTVTGTTYAVTGLTASTTYSFYVKAKDAAGNVSAASSTINVTTSASIITYCASKGTSVADEWIGKVVCGTISNTTGANAGYADFTALSTNMTKGSTYTITVTPAWSGTVYKEGYAIWIDYNKDGDFLDAGELVGSVAATSTTPVSKTFTVPTTAITGTTRMRVSMKYNAIPTSCETFSYGEVEDYTVNLVVVAGAENMNLTSLFIYPNPARDEIKINLQGVENMNTVYIYSITGSLVKEAKVSEYENTINVSDLPAGIYNIRMIEQNNVITGKFIKK